MGYMVYMDENGDAEGNYTLVARKLMHNVDGVSTSYGIVPIGVFLMAGNSSHLPVS